MHLTAVQHPEAIKRYAHLKPARGRSSACGARCPGTSHACSREENHRGPHVAHGFLRRVVAVWDGIAATPERRRSAPPVPSRSRPRGRPIGLKSDRPAGIWRALRERAFGAVSSMEELVFLVFFVAFAGFALYWLTLLLG